MTNGYSVTYNNSAGVKVANPIDAGTYKVVVEGTETTGNNPLTGVWQDRLLLILLKCKQLVIWLPTMYIWTI